MVAYRFCRTDDIELLVEAHNRCVLPHFPDRPALTVAGFKRAIRELNLRCSSCMVAMAGGEPAAVMLGAKREHASAIQVVAVHPEHLRQGYGRHLLRSIEKKLAILGPPRIVAEVDGRLDGAHAFFEACGWRREGRLADFVLEPADAHDARSNIAELAGPVTVDDLLPAGMLDDRSGLAWGRTKATLVNLRDDLSGLAVASAERIEAFFLARRAEDGQVSEIMRLGHGGGESGRKTLQLLLAHESRGRGRTLEIDKVAPAEIEDVPLEAWGFRRVREHVCYATEARARHV